MQEVIVPVLGPNNINGGWWWHHQHRIYHRVKGKMCVRSNGLQSNGQEPLCDVVQLSNSKNDSQNFLSHSCD